MRTYYVYKHTTPSNKVYIGVTSQKVPELRWGLSGQRYRRNRHFWNAINLYGWDNISHEIIASGLEESEALSMEVELIAKYNSSDPRFGYNSTSGGEVSSQVFNDEVIEILRRKTAERWSNPDYRRRVVSKMVGHPVSDETKRKISLSKLGRKLGKPSPLKGRKLSEQAKEKLRGKVPWSYGKTKYTDASVKRISEKLKGRVFTDTHREKISSAKKKLYNSGFTTVWMHDLQSEHLVNVSMLDEYLHNGFELGRLDLNFVYIFKDSDTKRVPSSDLDSYLSSGWNLGKSETIRENIRKSKLKYIYRYQDFECYSAKEMAFYLREHGYNEIAISTVTNIANGKFIPKYAELCDALIVSRYGDIVCE